MGHTSSNHTEPATDSPRITARPERRARKKKQPSHSGTRDAQAGAKGNASQKEPVVLGVTFHDDTPDRPVCYVSREGNYAFDRQEAVAVKEVILESARFLGYGIPDMFIPLAAEVFYDEVKLVKVRLAGKYVAGLDDTGKVKYKPWETPEAPRFTVGPDYKLRVAEEDRGKAYVAMLNYGHAVWFSWDLSPHYGRDMRPEDEVNYYVLEFQFFRGEPTGAAGGVKMTNAEIISEAEELLRDVAVEDLQNILVPRPPADVSGEQLAVKLSDPFRRLTYIYDRGEAEYRLALRYATSVRFDEREIREFAESNSVSFARAKALTVLQHQKSQKAFVEENLMIHHRKSVELLKYVFTNSLIQEVNTATLADWKSSLVVKKQHPDELKDVLIGDAVRDMKERLGRSGQGRPGKSPETVARENAEREAKIRKAMRDVFEEALSAGEDVFAAEDAVSAKAVYERLGIAKSTLYEWLENCGWEFAKLRCAAIGV